MCVHTERKCPGARRAAPASFIIHVLCKCRRTCRGKLYFWWRLGDERISSKFNGLQDGLLRQLNISRRKRRDAAGGGAPGNGRDWPTAIDCERFLRHRRPRKCHMQPWISKQVCATVNKGELQREQNASRGGAEQKVNGCVHNCALLCTLMHASAHGKTHGNVKCFVRYPVQLASSLAVFLLFYYIHHNGWQTTRRNHSLVEYRSFLTTWIFSVVALLVFGASTFEIRPGVLWSSRPLNEQPTSTIDVHPPRPLSSTVMAHSGLISGTMQRPSFALTFPDTHVHN